MKIHTTNYFNTLIEIAEDSKTTSAIIPTLKSDKITIAYFQFDFINRNKYVFTSDEILFEAFVRKNDITVVEKENAKKQFFSKGQACFRCSPLAKNYGWGFHFNNEGKVAIYSADSEEYLNLMQDEKITKVKAMRNKKK